MGDNEKSQGRLNRDDKVSQLLYFTNAILMLNFM